MNHAQRFPFAEASQAHDLLGRKGMASKIMLMLGPAMFFERPLWPFSACHDAVFLID